MLLLRSLQRRLWPLEGCLSRYESELFESILELILLGVVPVLEPGLLLFEEFVLVDVFDVFQVVISLEMHRWRHLFAEEFLPIDAFEEIVLLCLF